MEMEGSMSEQLMPRYINDIIIGDYSSSYG